MGWIDEMLVGIPVNAVLRERLTLEAEKRGATLTENVALKSENAVLRSENEGLKSQVVNLRQEIQRRDDIIQKEKSHGTILEEVRVKLLQFLAKKSNSVTASDAARALNIGEQLAMFHLTDMEKQKFITASYASNAPIEWRIGQSGRAYLVTHGLLT